VILSQRYEKTVLHARAGATMSPLSRLPEPRISGDAVHVTY
jgi:hypothetical protein